MTETIPYIIQEDGFYFVSYKEKVKVPEIVVSSKGVANGLSEEFNDGWDFGPDSYNPTSTSAIPYTQTLGILEAGNYAIENNVKVKLTAGTYFCTSTIHFTPSGSNTLVIEGPDDSGAYASFGGNTSAQIIYTGGSLSEEFFLYDGPVSGRIIIRGIAFVANSGTTFTSLIPFVRLNADTLVADRISIVNGNATSGAVPQSESIGLLIGYALSDNKPLIGDMKILKNLWIIGWDWGFVGNGDWIHLYDTVTFSTGHYAYMWNVQDVGSTSYNATWSINSPMMTRCHAFDWGYVAIYDGSSNGSPGAALWINDFYAETTAPETTAPTGYPSQIGIIQDIYSKPIIGIRFVTNHSNTIPDIAQPTGDVPGTTSGVPGPYSFAYGNYENTVPVYDTSATAIDFSSSTYTAWNKRSPPSFASGTVYQNVNLNMMHVKVVVQLSATSSAAATATLMEAPVNSTSSQNYSQENEPAGVTAGEIHTLEIDVFPNNIFELQLTNATIVTYAITYEPFRLDM